MQTMITQDSSKKRLHDGQLKLQAPLDIDEIVDLTNVSEDESFSTSKRAKSSSLTPGSEGPLSFLSSYSPSRGHPKAHVGTSSDKIFTKKTQKPPLFKSPSWRYLDVNLGGAAPSIRRLPIIRTLSAGRGPHKGPETPESTKSEFAVTTEAIIPSSDRVKDQTQYGFHQSIKLNKPISRSPLQAQPEAHEDPFENRSRIRTRSSTATRSSHARLTPDKASARRGHLEPLKSSPGILHVSVTGEYHDRVGNLVSGPHPRTSAASPKTRSSSRRSSKEAKQAALLEAGSTVHPRLPSRPKVVVEIGTPRHHSPGSDSRSLLDKFQQPLRTNGDSLRQIKRRGEAYVLAELKRDTTIARTRASTVEAHFPHHGLSGHYDDVTAINQRKSVAQPKVRKVNRSKVKLDWGISQPASPFEPADVISPAEQARRILDAKFEDATNGALLTFYNDRNDRQIDGKFQFVDSYIYRDAVPKLNSGPSDVGCMCTKRCDPTDTACQCLRPQMSDLHVPAPYVVGQGGLVLLNPDFIQCAEDTRKEIFECNDMCGCSKDCFNRIVQKGRTIPLQIFMTKNCGFGIRSPRPIKKGQFIDVYLGELLTTKAIEEYELATTEQSCSYVFSLDYFNDSASYHIQGLHFGSPTRFINHSCNPNTRTFTVMMNHADQKIYKLAYFAIKDIPAMKEITFDYSPDTANEDPLVPSQVDLDEGVVRCLCGEWRCRGRIWPKRQMPKARGKGSTRT